MTASVVESRFWMAAGWTMLHFLWVGVGVGLLAASARLILRTAHPGVRYVVALLFLVALATAPCVIYTRGLDPPPAPVSSSDVASAEPVRATEPPGLSISENAAGSPLPEPAPAARPPSADVSRSPAVLGGTGARSVPDGVAAVAGGGTTRLARSYYMGGDRQRAIEAYRGYLNENPAAGGAVREELAWVYLESGHYRSARNEYRTALSDYQQDLNRGHNAEAARHGVRTCESALRALETR